MKVFLAALILVGVGVFGMCFNIIFRKDGEFPEYEVGENKKMREMGIRCMREQEEDLFPSKGGNNKKKHRNCETIYTDDCKSCGFYPKK